MKWMITLLSFLTTLVGSAQQYFQLQTKFDTTRIILNGKVYEIDSNLKKVPTRFPHFDTLQILDGSWRKETKIVCNFKPDSSYTFFMNCCAMTDIAPSSKFTRINPDTIHSDTDEETPNYDFLDRPSFTLKIKNGSEKDTIYAWYVDYACFPSFKRIDEKGWNYGVPSKCFYWSNISPFTFFKSDQDYSKMMNESGVVEDDFPYDFSDNPAKPEILGTIYVRLFDDEKFVITYDVKKKRIRMEYGK